MNYNYEPTIDLMYESQDGRLPNVESGKAIWYRTEDYAILCSDCATVEYELGLYVEAVRSRGREYPQCEGCGQEVYDNE